jgi:hypothetical protein
MPPGARGTSCVNLRTHDPSQKQLPDAKNRFA